eukprot:1156659-Pelagomonas_calceolata.AAC.3
MAKATREGTEQTLWCVDIGCTICLQETASSGQLDGIPLLLRNPPKDEKTAEFAMALSATVELPHLTT